MKYLWMFIAPFTLCPDFVLASTQCAPNTKHIKSIGTYNQLGYVTKQWYIQMREESDPNKKILVNKDIAGTNSDRGRVLYALAQNAMNNHYEVRLMDNHGRGSDACLTIDEIDIFRAPLRASSP